MTGRYRAITGYDLPFVCWGEDTIVYHSGSGDTHLLNPVAAQGLALLQEAPADADELAQRLAALLQVEVTPDLKLHMATLLRNLEERGLIEPAGPGAGPGVAP